MKTISVRRIVSSDGVDQLVVRQLQPRQVTAYLRTNQVRALEKLDGGVLQPLRFGLTLKDLTEHALIGDQLTLDPFADRTFREPRLQRDMLDPLGVISGQRGLDVS